MFTCSSPNSVQNGCTALHVASRNGHLEVIRMLLKAKADVNIMNNVSRALVIMPRCACASEVYGSVFVCLSVCVVCYSCSRINEVQVRVSIVFYSLVMFSWI